MSGTTNAAPTDALMKPCQTCGTMTHERYCCPACQRVAIMAASRDACKVCGQVLNPECPTCVRNQVERERDTLR